VKDVIRANHQHSVWEVAKESGIYIGSCCEKSEH
jgi:hypothetical protein